MIINIQTANKHLSDSDITEKDKKALEKYINQSFNHLITGSSGNERKYGPKKWNDGKFKYRLDNDNIPTGIVNGTGKVQFSTNCYAYALDFSGEVTYSTYDGYKLPYQKEPQPGFLFKQFASKQEQEKVNERIEELPYPQQIIEKAKLDAKIGDYTFKSTEKGILPEGNHWKVALVVEYNDSEYGDYHWYRQNPDGTWSQKTGFLPATNLDGVDRLIKNPSTCNRDNTSIGGSNYNVFVGYFEVGPNNGDK